jgi:hypothetical protein
MPTFTRIYLAGRVDLHRPRGMQGASTCLVRAGMQVLHAQYDHR